jgi:hypothetical protein
LQARVADAEDIGSVKGLLDEAVTMLYELRNIDWNYTKEEKLLRKVAAELDRATMKFGDFKNAHEGYAVMMGEVDELWDAVKMRYGADRDIAIHEEAVQVAAMAVRILRDVCKMVI